MYSYEEIEELFSEFNKLFQSRDINPGNYLVAEYDFYYGLRFFLSHDFTKLEERLQEVEDYLGQIDAGGDDEFSDDVQNLCRNYKFQELSQVLVSDSAKLAKALRKALYYRIKYNIGAIANEVLNAVKAEKPKLRCIKIDFIWTVFILLVDNGAVIGSSKQGRSRKGHINDKTVFRDICSQCANGEYIFNDTSQLGELQLAKFISAIKLFQRKVICPTTFDVTYPNKLFDCLPDSRALERLSKLFDTAGLQSVFFDDPQTFYSAATKS